MIIKITEMFTEYEYGKYMVVEKEGFGASKNNNINTLLF